MEVSDGVSLENYINLFQRQNLKILFSGIELFVLLAFFPLIRAIRIRSNMATTLSESEKSEIIAMALSDHVSFKNIYNLYGLQEKDVKTLMRTSLKEGSYKAWRKRVREFSDRREHYK